MEEVTQTVDIVALYRKYRSQDFDQLIGQEHVASTLENALETRRISHAYLFTGPRGTGKTSAARIFACRLNEIDDVHNAVDIIEIDAASNNGVDEIRELREKVHVAPNYLSYKVYIIDEVHMLSSAAFNALLKTLEEPPAHAVFILATTEPHKLPQTITSRTQHFPFYPVPRDTLSQHLRTIADSEEIQIEDEALRLLAELGEGSVRDGISLLDQLSGRDESITVDHVYSVVGIAQHDHIRKLMEAAIDQKTTEVLQFFDEILDNGAAMRSVMKQLLDVTRQYVRNHINDADMRLYNARMLLSALSSIPQNVPHLSVSIEAALLSVCYTAGGSGTEPQGADTFQQHTAPAPRSTATNEQSTHSHTKTSSRSSAKKKKRTSSSQEKPVSRAPSPSAAIPESVWVKTLSFIKQKNTSLYGLLRNTQVDFSEEGCIMTAKFTFHHRRLMEHGNYATIKDALRQAHGEEVAVHVVLDQTQQSGTDTAADSSDSTDQDTDENALKQVFDILGGEKV